MGRMTTPPSVVVIKFRLDTDETCTAANAKGHYAFHAAEKTIDWLDGIHREQFSKTEISRRSNGAPRVAADCESPILRLFFGESVERAVDLADAT